MIFDTLALIAVERYGSASPHNVFLVMKDLETEGKMVLNYEIVLNTLRRACNAPMHELKFFVDSLYNRGDGLVSAEPAAENEDNYRLTKYLGGQPVAEYTEISYKIDSYVDGDIDVCGACSDITYATVWDGTFYCTESYTWLGSAECINGKSIGAFSPSITYSTTTGLYTLQISCSQLGTQNVVWRGTKSGGIDPVGIYLRTSGCSSATALSVVEN